MVLKLYGFLSPSYTRFENDVKMYGTQAQKQVWMHLPLFENDVKMYGTQAKAVTENYDTTFENDVKM